MAVFDPSVYINTSGVVRTTALFIETHNKDPDFRPVFTLSDNEKEGLVNLKKHYLAHCVEDPTEYNFALAVFGSWHIWDKIRVAVRISPYVDKWRRECDVARKSIAFKAIIKETRMGKTPTAAARYLIEEPWKGKTKEVKDKVKETIEEAYSTVSDDLERLKENGLIQ